MFSHHGRSMLLIVCVGALLCACVSAATPMERVQVVTVLVTEQPRSTPIQQAVVTVTRAPTQTPAPTTAQVADKGEAGVLFEEHFDSDRRSWFTGPDSSSRAYCGGGVDKGKYTMYAVINTDYSYCHVDLPAFRTSDGTITVKTSLESTTAGEGEVNIGLLWRLQDDDKGESFYFFNDGTYRMLHWENGKSTELQPRVYSEYINFKQGMTNVLSVTAKGNLFTVFANGHPLYAVNSERAAASGKLAIQVGADKVGQMLWVDFDDVLVTQPVGVPSLEEMIAMAPTPEPTPTKRPLVVNTPRPRPTAAVVTAAPAPTAAPATAAPVADQYIMYFHFGAQGCPYSRRTGPAVESFYKAYTGRVQVIGVPVDGWGSDVQDFRNATGISFPVQNGAGPGVDTNRIPQIVLVNQRTGQVTHISEGVISYQSLSNSVSAVMSGHEPRTYVGTS